MGGRDRGRKRGRGGGRKGRRGGGREGKGEVGVILTYIR